MKKFFVASIFLGVIIGSILTASHAQALSILDDRLIKEVSCVNDEGKPIPKCDYTLNSFITLGINVSNIILGVVGALTLAMFIYGGLTLLLSGGSSEKVSKGKEIILGSVVGLLIVFGSYTIINFVVNTVFEAKVNVNGNLEPAFTGEAPSDPERGRADDCISNGGQCINDALLCNDGYGQNGILIQANDCSGGKKCCVLPKTTPCESPVNPSFRCEITCPLNYVQKLSPPLYCPDEGGFNQICCVPTGLGS